MFCMDYGMDSSIESIDTWFGTLYFVYGLGLETPKLISC